LDITGLIAAGDDRDQDRSRRHPAKRQSDRTAPEP
jgi:hypothetical protein